MISLKQKLAFKFMVENGGNLGQAMIAAGYSANTAKTPQKLTRTKAWAELTQHLLPDEFLLREHSKLLKAKKLNGEIDVPAVVSALDMAYRLKGRYSKA